MLKDNILCIEYMIIISASSIYFLIELYFNNFKVKEVHSIFKNRIRGESSVNFRLIIESFFGLFKVYKKKKGIINKIS